MDELIRAVGLVVVGGGAVGFVFATLFILLKPDPFRPDDDDV